jgi:uncharacterized Fe-S center protein
MVNKMEKAKVYFTDLHTRGGVSLLDKLRKLIKAAGIDRIDFKDKFTAVKIHFGEPGNLAYIRPNFARVVCDVIKENGGKPFLTDCNTLYVGGRKNAVDHLESAYANGFNPLVTGVHCIIADGLKGLDERILPVRNGVYCKEAKVGEAIADADIIITMSHFKGHVSAGFGGAIKNIGMGGGSRSGKQIMHSEGTPKVIEDRCVGCGTCARNCAHEGIAVVDRKARIDESKCLGCGRCIAVCPKDAVVPKWDTRKAVLSCKMAEYAMAMLDGKPNFHISFVTNVSPDCDCEGHNDVPIVPDVGIFASYDPVALDQACVDAVNAMPLIPDSVLADKFAKSGCSCGADHPEYFKMNHPNTEWKAGQEHAEKIGLGTTKYELINVG